MLRDRRTIRWLCAALAAGGLACSGEPAPAPAPSRPSGPPAQAPAPEATAGEATPAEYRYDPADKRDPFRSFVRSFEPDESTQTPLERFDLTQLVLTGIVWGNDGPRALIKDPAGKGYIVTVGTVMGKNKGRITTIDDNMVVIKETYVDALNRATTKNVEMRLREAQGG